MTRACALTTAAFLLAAGSPAAEKMKPEELVRLHLESVSPDASRFAPRVVRGTCIVFGKQIGQGSLQGTFALSSAPPASRLVLEFGAYEYGAEVFSFDGKDTEIGFSNKARGRRSVVAAFIAENDTIVREGLLGGVLNGSWPLAALAERGAKVSYDGLKKLDDRQLHRLKYRAKKGQRDLEISLWFEPDTYRHVATVYTLSRTQSMVSDPTQSSRQSDIYFRLDERFADFKSTQGLALPSKWTIRYEASANVTTEWRYEMAVEQVEKK
jgi:hypothetical protein